MGTGASLNPSASVGNGPTFVSTYSGAGGLDAGFIDAGWKPVWANDIDPDAVDTYNRNISGEHAVQGPIEAHRSSLPTAGTVDVVIGGPPCQGFSVAGHLRPEDPRSLHVWTFLEVVEQLQPRAFVMENVKALAATRRWAGLATELVRKARALEYNADIFVLNAAEYGVPQRRERMFLIGMRDSVPTEPVPSTKDKPPTARQALEKLPPYGAPGNDSLCPAIITPAKRPVLRRSPYAGLLLNGKGRVLNLDAPALTLPASMGGNRTPIIDQQNLDGGDEWIVRYHKRLMSGKPPLGSIPSRLRRLTVEEAAAIQGFRRGWTFSGRRNAQFRQIGNSVPPRLAYSVARHVRDLLEGSGDVGGAGVEATVGALAVAA